MLFVTSDRFGVRNPNRPSGTAIFGRAGGHPTTKTVYFPDASGTLVSTYELDFINDFYAAAPRAGYSNLGSGTLNYFASGSPQYFPSGSARTVRLVGNTHYLFRVFATLRNGLGPGAAVPSIRLFLNGAPTSGNRIVNGAAQRYLSTGAAGSTVTGGGVNIVPEGQVYLTAGVPLAASASNSYHLMARGSFLTTAGNFTRDVVLEFAGNVAASDAAGYQVTNVLLVFIPLPNYANV